MSARRGLPSAVKMRHDAHYVDALLFKEGEVVGRMIPIADVYPNKEQPRKHMGDIEQLSQSIAEHGVLEPILVTKESTGYQIISGERRYLAAVDAKLRSIPCIVKNLQPNEILEIALVENLQRKDLHPIEAADGLQTLVERHHYTHEQIAQRIGKSRSTVSELLTIARFSLPVREAVFAAGISAKSMLLALTKMDSEAQQLKWIEQIARGAKREEVRRQHKKQQRAKPYVFRFKDPHRTFSFDLKFKRSEVSKDEVIDTLERVLSDLKSS